VYRTATILWLLTAVVLTNICISRVVADLNVPLKGSKLKTIDELVQNSKTLNERKTYKLSGNILNFYPTDIVFDLHTKTGEHKRNLYFDKQLESKLRDIAKLQRFKETFD